MTLKTVTSDLAREVFNASAVNGITSNYDQGSGSMFLLTLLTMTLVFTGEVSCRRPLMMNRSHVWGVYFLPRPLISPPGLSRMHKCRADADWAGITERL